MNSPMRSSRFMASVVLVISAWGSRVWVFFPGMIRTSVFPKIPPSKIWAVESMGSWMEESMRKVAMAS